MTLKNRVRYSVDEFEQKVDAAWNYWESLGLSPRNIRPSENSFSIAVVTSTGGEVTYSAGRYGEYLTSDSVCSVEVVVSDDGSAFQG